MSKYKVTQSAVDQLLEDVRSEQVAISSFGAPLSETPSRTGFYPDCFFHRRKLMAYTIRT